jgi:hypothetical protein
VASAKPKLSGDAEISRKLDVVIALLLRSVASDAVKPLGTSGGEIAAFLRQFDLSYEDISRIVGSPVGSLRELVSRGTRAGGAKRRRK